MYGKHLSFRNTVSLGREKRYLLTCQLNWEQESAKKLHNESLCFWCACAVSNIKFKASLYTEGIPAPVSCASFLRIKHQAPQPQCDHCVRFLLFQNNVVLSTVFERHLQLEDMALLYWTYSALASWDTAGRSIELNWETTDVPVGHRHPYCVAPHTETFWKVRKARTRVTRHKSLVWTSWPITLTKCSYLLPQWGLPHLKATWEEEAQLPEPRLCVNNWSDDIISIHLGG
jgi:hypothetical protein